MNPLFSVKAFPTTYAILQENRFRSRVLGQSGFLVDSQLPFELYQQFARMGKYPMHAYSSGGGYTRRNSGGVNYVPGWIDLINASPVNFVQATESRQPSVSADGDVSAFPVLKFDRSDDFMDNADLAMFKSKQAGTVIAVVKDDFPTTADATHVAFIASTGTSSTSSRINLLTRNTSNIFVAGGRRTDASGVASSTAANATGFHFLVNSSIWVANTLQLRVDSTAASSVAFAAGSGSTDSTDSQIVRIGASDATTNRFGGSYGELLLFDTALTAAELTALQTIFRKYYPTLP